jgi:F-type H+-transporting ATPase subunit delta
VRPGLVTARYAEALFGLAQRRGALDAVRRDVERIAEGVSSPAVREYLFNPHVASEKKRAKLRSLVGGFHQLTRNLVDLLLDKRREEVLRDLGPVFRRRVDQEEGRVEGTLEAARPLGQAQVNDIAAAFGAKLGKTVVLRQKTAPELVGGVRVVVENRMLDFSVQARLAGLRRKMLEAPLPSESRSNPTTHNE